MSLTLQLDPTKANKKAVSRISKRRFSASATNSFEPTLVVQAAVKKAMLHRRLGRAVDMNNQEEVIALDAVNPEDLDTSLADIGGLEQSKAALVSKSLDWSFMSLGADGPQRA